MNILNYIRNLFKTNKKNATLYTTTLHKKYGEDEALEIGLYDKQTPITDEPIGIEINNKQYIKKTDTNGIAQLNINLPVGSYTAKIYWRGNNTYNKITAYSNVIITTDTYMDGINLTKYEGENTPYQCAVYRQDTHERIAGTVKLTINGKTYERTPDPSGLYKLNINLGVGSYPIQAEFTGSELFNPSSTTNTIVINEAPAPEPEPTPEPKTYSEEIREYFESKFGEMSCIDDCLEAIQGNGYGYYYDDQYSNYTSINRMANGQGVNCTDSCQVFWHLGKALGYDVQCLHIGCSGGDGHVRLQFKHPERTGGEWINRDPAAVLNGNSITSIWCSNGTLWAVNPDWFMENLNR